jgi:hypothetical protein
MIEADDVALGFFTVENPPGVELHAGRSSLGRPPAARVPERTLATTDERPAALYD